MSLSPRRLFLFLRGLGLTPAYVNVSGGCTNCPEPLKTEWYYSENDDTDIEKKESLGRISLLHWHCGLPMHHVDVFMRRLHSGNPELNGVRKNPGMFNKWICTQCNNRCDDGSRDMM